MNSRFFIGIVSCIMAISLHAETIRVMRFVPIAGTESEVAIDSLQKVVFTQDSIVLIAAQDGEATPMYKYDYQRILFAENSSSETEVTVSNDRLEVSGEKFIKDGQLFILYEGQMYDVQGRRVN